MSEIGRFQVDLEFLSHPLPRRTSDVAMARPNCAVQLRAGGEWAPAVRGRKVKGGFMVTLSGGASNNAPIFVSAPCVRPLSWAGCKRARESQGDAASPPRKRGPAAPTRRQIYINREIAREGVCFCSARLHPCLPASHIALTRGAAADFEWSCPYCGPKCHCIQPGQLCYYSTAFG